MKVPPGWPIFLLQGIGKDMQVSIYPKTYFESANERIDYGTCFVIMPFGPTYDEVYREVLTECLEESGFAVTRSDELYGSKPIMEDILERIDSAEVIIADLTQKNPNVFYELGITHTRKENNNVIMITQSLDDVPFDLRPFRVIIYEPTISGAKILRSQLSKTLLEYRLNPLNWSGSEWQPATPIWFTDDDHALIGEQLWPHTVPMIFSRKPVKASKFCISFIANSTGPEVNLVFLTNGRDRFSGYHLWYWQDGVKLRRLGSEVKLDPTCKLESNVPTQITLDYNEGEILMKVEDRDAISFTDVEPLHKKKGLEHMGFNISFGPNKGRVRFQDLKIGY